MGARFLGLILLVVLLAAIVIVVLRVRELLADRAAWSVTGPARRHQRAVDEARRRVRTAQRAHDQAVHRARTQLVEAGRDPVLAAVGPVILGACTLTVRQNVHELGPSTVFRVDVEGEIRQVVTRRDDQERAVRDDQREVFLTVTDDAWADVVKLVPAQLEGARRLAAVGAAAVRNLAAARDERDARLLAAQDELERVLADTAEVDGARMTLEDLEGVGPRRIDVPEPPPERPDEEDPPDDEDGVRDDGR
jgi:hypothetical protein